MAKVFVITGPSGVGKGTLIEKLLAARTDVELSISATTRTARAGENNGTQYIFLTRDQFRQRVQAGDFLEHATYTGHSYGTPISEINKRLEKDVSVVLEIEIQGARQVRAKMPEAIQIFIKPPSEHQLRLRLEGRGTDDPAQIESRLITAHKELVASTDFGFDKIIINDSIDRAAAELIATVDQIIAQQ